MKLHCLALGAALCVGGFVAGCSDSGTGTSGPAAPITTTADLIGGQWWTELAFDTIIVAKRDSAGQSTVTTTYKERHRLNTVASVGAGQNGGVDNVIRTVDTFVSAVGAIDSVRANTVVYNQKGGKFQTVFMVNYVLVLDTFTYTRYQFPLTTGTAWRTACDSLDTLLNLRLAWLRAKGSVVGSAQSAAGMLSYSFADSQRQCFSISENDTAAGAMTLDTALAGLGFVAGYVIGNGSVHTTRSEYFCPQFGLPLYSRSVVSACDSTFPFVGLTTPGQTYDTTKTTARVIALFDPRWSPADTLHN
jgi:hypothetical protein